MTSLNVQPLTLKVVVRPVHGHVWHSPCTLNQSQHGYIVLVFLDATSILEWLDHGEANSLFYITADNNCLFAMAIAYISTHVSANKHTYFSKTHGKLFSSAISATDMCTIHHTRGFALKLHMPSHVLMSWSNTPARFCYITSNKFSIQHVNWVLDKT